MSRAGSELVVLPSYGRDREGDYDYFASKVGDLRSSALSRGIAGQKGTMEAVTLHDLAADIAAPPPA